MMSCRIQTILPTDERREFLEIGPDPIAASGPRQASVNWFRENEHVNIQLRNLGAEKGANLVTLDVLEKEGNLYKGSGRAFSCQDVAMR